MEKYGAPFVVQGDARAVAAGRQHPRRGSARPLGRDSDRQHFAFGRCRHRAWTELVGGGVAAPGSATTRPTYNATGFNNKTAAIIFDGIDDYLRRDQAWLAGATAGEIWGSYVKITSGPRRGDKIVISVGGSSGSTTIRQIIRTLFDHQQGGRLQRQRGHDRLRYAHHIRLLRLSHRAGKVDRHTGSPIG